MSFWDDVEDTASDGVDWVEDTAEDVADDVGDVIDDIGDAAGDAIDGIGDALEATAQAAEAAAEATWNTAQDAYQAAGDVASAVMDPVMETVVNPVGDALLGGLEDSGFFDVVDYASLDLIDMSYGDNGFNLDFGIDDIAAFDLNAGNGGLSFQGDYGGQHLGVAWNDDGFSAAAALGIDWARCRTSPGTVRSPPTATSARAVNGRATSRCRARW